MKHIINYLVIPVLYLLAIPWGIATISIFSIPCLTAIMLQFLAIAANHNNLILLLENIQNKCVFIWTLPLFLIEKLLETHK